MSNNSPVYECDVAIIGAGPTGLAAAGAIVKDGGTVAIVERSGSLGGLARSAVVAGHVIDPGGHRLLAATAEQRSLWESLADRLGMIRLHYVNRASGMLRNGNVIAYPFDWAQFRQATPWSMRAMTAASALKSRMLPIRPEETLSDWVENRYGAYLSDRLMEPHARKVFGVDPRTIPATWAAQRIAVPPLSGIVGSALPCTKKTPSTQPEVSEFLYPDGGLGVVWSRLAASLCQKAKFFLDARVTDVIQPISGDQAIVRVAGAADIKCRRVIWTGRPEDLATVMGSPRLAADLSRKSSRRDLVVAVVHVHSVSPQWDSFQCLYTNDRGVEAQRFQNYAEWTGLHTPRGVIGLEYSVTPGSIRDIRSAVVSDLSILGVPVYELLGFEVLHDAYSSFDSTRALLKHLADLLRGSAVPVLSTGRQGAGIYINMDQALRLGARAASLTDFRGVLDDSVYTGYQETTDRFPSPVRSIRK